MRKYILFPIVFLLMLCNSVAAKKKDKENVDGPVVKAPSKVEFQRIADSILAEGVELYGYEKISWMTSDSASVYCKNMSDVGRYYVYKDGSAYTCFFTDRKAENVVFCGKGKIEELASNLQWSNMVRPLTDEEKEVIQEQSTCLEKLSVAYGDSIYNMTSANGSLNVDIIKNKSGYRMYILQGTTNMGVIPFGNDYILDFDKDFNITSFKRCHKSYLAIPVEAGKVESSIHSHTPDNPYMTVTDVCTSLLYGRDLYGIQSFTVYSTHFTGGFMIVFDTNSMAIVGLDSEFIKKVYGK